MTMGNKVLAILLSAKNQASGPIKTVTRDISTMDRVAGRAGSGVKTLGRNLSLLGGVAVVGLAAAVKTGLDDLKTLETATTSVDGAIRQMGLTGKVTGAQVAGWANEIEASIGAAFDDKAITAATATLIRFGKVTPGNLRPAMQVITDLATKTGSVDSAATLLAKALADPTKAAGKLARSGVVLTKQQQDQIKAFMKAGKTAQAQKVILDSLTKTTKGAAAASQGPYERALSVLADVSEDARKALAEGFLPVIERVATVLSKKLADPAVIADIRSFGQSVAGFFDKAVTFAEQIDWSSIGTAMKLTGQGAKAAYDLFNGMPDWVKQAALTGWGLNKLTGGALTGIVGELGKGLIKGVLGMNAGVVNINAGVVNGGGGLPGSGTPGVPGAPVPAAAGGLLAPGFATLVAGIAVPLIMFDVIPALASAKGGNELAPGRKLGLNDSVNQTMVSVGLGNLIRKVVAEKTPATDPRGKHGPDGLDRSFGRLASDTKAEGIATRRSLDGVKEKQAAALVAFRASERASETGFSRVTSSIAANQANVTTNVSVYVSAADVTKKVTVHNRAGRTSSAHGGSHRSGMD
jgi:hypothetical protein